MNQPTEKKIAGQTTTAMQLLRATFEKDGSGEVKMIPHESEDMWHAYNLIAVGDRLTATAIRFEMRETQRKEEGAKKKKKIVMEKSQREGAK